MTSPMPAGQRPSSVAEEPALPPPLEEERKRMDALRSIRARRLLRARSVLAQAQCEVERSRARIASAQDKLAHTMRSAQERRRNLQSGFLDRSVRREDIETLRQGYCKLDREIGLEREALLQSQQQHLDCLSRLEESRRSFHQASKAQERLDQGLQRLHETGGTR